MKQTGFLSSSSVPYTFEGQARQRPLQSYAGSVAEKNRADLLRHLDEERRRRERSRQCEAASTKIQSAWRRYLTRKQQRQNFAQVFHKLVEQIKDSNSGACDVQSADMLIRLMVFNRSDMLLEDDINWFASQILKDVPNFLPVLLTRNSSGKPVMYRLNGFLFHILRRVCSSSRPTTAFRLLEKLLNPATYSSLAPQEPNFASETAKEVVQYLIDHDFYETLFKSLIAKTDPKLELLEGQQFPSGFPGAILQLMILPVSSATNAELCNLVVSFLVFDVICRPEAIVSRFILPAFLQNIVAEKMLFLVCRCLFNNRHRVAQLAPAASIHVVWFILMCLKKTDLQKLSLSDCKDFLECLALLLGQMPAIDRQQEEPTAIQVDDDSDDDEDQEAIFQLQNDIARSASIWATLPNYARTMHSEVITMVCSDRSFAYFLRHVINMSKLVASKTDDDCTCQIAQLFYELIYRHGVTPGKLRVSSLPVFDKDLLRRFYFKMTSLVGPVGYLVHTTLLQRVQSGIVLQQAEYGLFVPICIIFCKFFHWLLLCVHDAEFMGQSTDSRSLIPFSTSELVDITSNFRTVCGGLVEVLRPRTVKSTAVETNMAASSKSYIPLFRAACHLLKHLYIRNCRLNFLPEGFWSSVMTSVHPSYPPPHGLVSFLLQPSVDNDSLLTGDFEPHLDPTMFNPRLMSITESHLAIVLTNVPFLLPFEYRYDVFRAVLHRDRDANSRSRPMGLDDGLTIDVRVRRQYLYEDAFDRLSLENAPNLKKRVRCQLVNFTGLDEAGIDGGGLFREFITELIRTAFDPNRGLFCYTPTAKDCRLYPNPAAEHLYPGNWKMHFFFLGRIVGKLLYEKYLVELPLADFFLAKILSRDSTSLDLHHLADLDPVLYKNLLFLKTYTGNVEDLDLDFTVADDSSSVMEEKPRVIELIPNGKQTPVTAENRILYTHLMADYKLNRRISAQCRAFLDGLSHVINIDWLRMFSPAELQTLISGAEKPINVADLMANTRYTGTFNEEHKTIQAFWSVVKHRLSEDQRRKLLKFVTSCSRPPMFGFRDLEPPFCIHSAGPPDQNGGTAAPGGGLRLPSASTCINLLKLPEYADEDTTYERLCYAIESQSGFELS